MTFFGALLGILGGFGLALRGRYYLNDGKIALGASLSLLGLFAFGGGYLLWWVGGQSEHLVLLVLGQ